MEAQDARWGKELALTQRNICTIWNREIDTDTFSEKKNRGGQQQQPIHHFT